MRVQHTIAQDFSCLSIDLLAHQLTHLCKALRMVQLTKFWAALQIEFQGKCRQRQLWQYRTQLMLLLARTQHILDMTST